MPIPLRDDGSAGPTKHLIVFVHGFNSSSSTWRELSDLVNRDPLLRDCFNTCVFDYKTGLSHLPVVAKLPEIGEAGKALGGFLDHELLIDNFNNRYIDVTLVGHSMGGLVIQSYLMDALTAGRGHDLNRIRQVILFATPNFGSSAGSGLRKLIFPFLSNPQERGLQQFSVESRAIHGFVRDKVVRAKRRTSHEYPLPSFCFWGESDGVVPSESALGHYPQGRPINGDHFTLHRPTSLDDSRYLAFRDVLVCPHGHPNVWEIERFVQTAKVSPLRTGSEIVAKHGVKQRTISCDNVAKVVRQIEFSHHNHCQDAYVLRYATRNEGWIEAFVNGPHSVPSDKQRLYDDHGTDVHFEVDPDKRRACALHMTVYKGFDLGHRDVHYHLGRSSYFKRVVFELDLTDYVKVGWVVDRPPQLYYHPTDPGDHQLCFDRELLNPDPPSRMDPVGLWTWELEHVKEGVVDIVFEVTPSRVMHQHQSISLAEGEYAIFGFGSLLSIGSIERTLGRRYNGPFVQCEIAGWRRSWDCAMPNTTFVFRDRGSWVEPRMILYLNMHPAPGRALNGVLFIVGEADLARFDEREWIYQRADVSSSVRGTTVNGGPVWAYVGRPEYVMPPPALPSTAAVRQSYLRILEDGQRDLGPEFMARYFDTSDAVPQHLVVEDHRKNEVSGV